jgi:capsular polysaccharide biosynthesis protein
LQELVSAKKAANVRVIQPAEIPVNADNLRMVVLAAGMMLCLFVGLAAAMLSEVFRRGYISSEKLERELGMPVLANVPVLTRAPNLIGGTGKKLG